MISSLLGNETKPCRGRGHRLEGYRLFFGLSKLEHHSSSISIRREPFVGRHKQNQVLIKRQVCEARGGMGMF